MVRSKVFRSLVVFILALVNRAPSGKATGIKHLELTLAFSFLMEPINEEKVEEDVPSCCGFNGTWYVRVWVGMVT